MKRELPSFFEAVHLLRSNPNTAGARVILSTGPAIVDASTGWRNNHALAAANKYVEVAVHSRADLNIELLDPSYFGFTLPRRSSSADGLHFIKPGAPKSSGGRRHQATDGSGDTIDCNGPVGEAYMRLLLDQVCGFSRV